MHTSDPHIFAVGDAIEVKDYVTDQWAHIPLAGPANRQGRIAAEVIVGRDSRFRGTQGTSIIGFSGARLPDGRQRKNAEAAGRNGLRKGLPLPEFPRRILSGRQVSGDERSSSANPMDVCSARRLSGRTGWTSASMPLRWRSRWTHRLRPGRGRTLLRAASLAAPRTPSTLPGWSRAMSCAATCR